MYKITKIKEKKHQEEYDVWQSGHARVRLGVMTKFALLVIVGAVVIFSEFFLLLSRMHLSALHHCVLELFPISRNPPGNREYEFCKFRGSHRGSEKLQVFIMCKGLRLL